MKNNLVSKPIQNCIQSDGRGYYAYLPAFFLYNDPSFAKSAEAERQVTGALDQFYLFKDDRGNVHNKYFPGIALLQAPFFGLACATSWFLGAEINGYSIPFQFCFLLGSLCYSLLALYFFFSSLKLLFPALRQKIPWLVILFYIATPLWFYNVLTPSFSHHYSFFLFTLFAFLALKIKEKITWQRILLLGFVTGIIALVRPTNLVIVLLLPFMMGNAEKTKEVWKELIANSGTKLWLGLLAFLSMLFLLILIWRWTSGQWFVWSYKGEGFNWFHPHFWENLFGFRIGLFVHTPLLLLSLWGSYFLYKTNRFRFIFWFIYFVVNMWVISAWWCWDYESSFGNRPTTEHLLFLVLPIFYLFEKRRKWLWFVGTLFCLLSSYRFQQYTTGKHPNQRFTPSSYFKSLQFWKSDANYRFNFTRSPEPFGKKIDEKFLLDFMGEKRILQEDEYPLGGEIVLDKPRTFERYYYRVELDKKISSEYFDGVYLVIDATNEDATKKYYTTRDLFNDREEGRTDWEHLIFEGTIIDNLQNFSHLKIYIWNKNKKEFSLRNVKITLTKYLAK